MSILRRYGNGIPGEGKGVYRRRVIRFPCVFLWVAGEHPADCHILWSAIILVWVLHCLLP